MWAWWLLALNSVVNILAPPAAVMAAEPSGVAIAVVQSAQANGQSGSRLFQTQGAVYSGDQIVTGAIGEAQVRFADNTKLVVGPNSRLVIDAFVFNNDKSARQFSINAVRGTFRFMTGNSAKDAYTITTPTATIGVRGTEFDFNVAGNGTTLALFSGSARVCDRVTRRCVLQVGRCSVSLSAPGRAPAVVKSARAQLDRLFRYIERQRGLRREFRVDTSSCDSQRVEAPSIEGSRAPPPLQTGSIIGPGPTTPPPPPPSPPPDEGGRSNNGLGNGGEGSEGPTETGNPGNGGNGGGNGNGKNK